MKMTAFLEQFKALDLACHTRWCLFVFKTPTAFDFRFFEFRQCYEKRHHYSRSRKRIAAVQEWSDDFMEKYGTPI
jgi:hypothetical protein